MLLNEGVDVNDKGEDGSTPLIRAVLKGNLTLAKCLIENGADVHAKNPPDDLTSLVLTSQFGNSNMIHLLLLHGANINASDQYGKTALHHSCRLYNHKAIRILLKYGADINAKNSFGNTPIVHFKYEDEINYKKIKLCVRLMVKHAATILFASSDEVCDQIMSFIDENPKVKQFFTKATEELIQMKTITFHGHYTFYCILLLSKNINKMALLTNNREFVRNFMENLELITYYREELLDILNEALEVNKNFEKTLKKLKLIFGDSLPDLILRKVCKQLMVVS